MRKVLMTTLVMVCSLTVFSQEDKPTYRLTEISEDPTGWKITLSNHLRSTFKLQLFFEYQWHIFYSSINQRSDGFKEIGGGVIY